MSESRKMLVRVLQRTNAEFVADRCGVHKSQVSRWASGETAPLPEHRKILEDNYGIPADRWTKSRYAVRA